MILLIILVLGGYAVYVMSPEERSRAAKRLEGLVRDGADVLAERRAVPEPFRDALRARTPWAYATTAVIGVMTLAWMLMTLGGGFADPSLIGWGASFGPVTTNGGWLRLATSLFLHLGFIHFVVNVIGLAQVGIVVERMLGHAAFAVVFCAAGLLASIDSLAAKPMAIVAGADGAIFGIYGLFAASLVWNARRPAPDELLQLGDLRAAAADGAEGDVGETPAPAPSIALTREGLIRLVPGAALFLLYHAADGVQTSELSGLVAGFAAGLVLAREAYERTAPLVPTASVAAVAAVLVLGSAAMLKGIADVRPEIARVVALENETVGQYEKAVGQFKNGGMSSQALARVIHSSIVPELQAARARLKAVNGVPAEHQPLVASADEYLRLRDESWRLRADALSKSNMGALRAADRSERASLEALERIKSDR